ncbi:MAG: hypothetical protein EKK51_17985 [Mycolicibacterium sp.]|uniref:hypothetical protein n=1 Tax=Mycolicibacterium sp. TaxID=2320850 RepID=UPI000F96AA5D|nr:hypothetical protein [Mycolicibacterium sp.]RUP30077.1 MAG: hypothetical protein EKK51_17985 [Mycolicibacterium sp.]
MSNGRPFAGRALLMSGGSHGIGHAIAVAGGALGANVVVLARSAVPDIMRRQDWSGYSGPDTGRPFRLPEFPW